MSSETMSKLESASKSHLHNIMQIAVFQLNDMNFYGINISKIRSIEDFKKYELIKNNTVQNPLLEGYIRYQNDVVPAISLEKWLDIYTPESVFLEYLICDYNKERLALSIHSIRNIFNVPIESLQKPDRMADTLTYEAIVEIDGEKCIVLVLDVEKLLFDVFGANYTIPVTNLGTARRLLIAEDSRTAQAIIRDIMKNSPIEYEIFNDGEELMEHLEKLDSAAIDGIGLIITDLEMPRKDGYQVLKFVKENNRYIDIPVVVNTSMSDEGVDEKTKLLGSAGFIAKTDPQTFLSVIAQFIRR
ncbi:MAG: chemotaxis protein CheV [Helicobacteraceae bacterium]|nr:chemotaxis protein CheV [Helicobacteraceae bacterium]